MSANDNALNVLVVGAGMYVCGRHTQGFGTILPTLVNAQMAGVVGEIFVAGASSEGVEVLEKKLDDLNTYFGSSCRVRTYPRAGKGEHDPTVYRKALAEIPRPASAIVAVPDHLHTSIAEDIVRSGIHLLVAKPLSPTLKEALHLVELAEANDVYGAVEFHKRFDEANLLLRKHFSEGRLGRLRYVTVEYSQRRQIRKIFNSWINHTNVFQYLGVHYVDIIYFVTAARPIRVVATGQPIHAMGKTHGMLDAIQAIVEWEIPRTGETFVSTIVTSWIDPNASSAMSDQKITAVGTGGRYYSDQKHRGVQLVTERGGTEEINPYFTQSYTGADGLPGVYGYGPRCIQQFLGDVRDLIAGRCPRRSLLATRPSFREALVSTAVIEAVNRSLTRGSEWIPIEET
ncbi:MAG: Gfo/Idh/MocA family protein [Candidatus Methylomirabilales bacterium]